MAQAVLVVSSLCASLLLANDRGMFVHAQALTTRNVGGWGQRERRVQDNCVEIRVAGLDSATIASLTVGKLYVVDDGRRSSPYVTGFQPGRNDA